MSAAHTHDHDHGHSHAPEVNSRNERIVLVAFLLTFTFMFAELIGGGTIDGSGSPVGDGSAATLPTVGTLDRLLETAGA